MIRWRKGWASVFLLGAAYGIVEEGLDVWTLFYSNADPVGTLGYYGHWLGINWVWSMGILIFHSIFSIGLPIFLFGLAFPEMKTKLLLSFHGIRNAFLILIADSLVLFVGDFSHYQGYNPGAGVLLFACIVTGLLIVTARKLPGDFLKISQGPPKWGPKRYALVGALFFPIEFLAGYVAAGANLPPLIPMVFDLALTLFVFTVVYKSMGSTLNEKQKTAFGVGLLLPIVAFGLIAGLGRWNFLIVVADLFVVLFARRLWRKWSNWTLLQQEHLTTTLPGLGGPSTSPFSS